MHCGPLAGCRQWPARSHSTRWQCADGAECVASGHHTQTADCSCIARQYVPPGRSRSQRGPPAIPTCPLLAFAQQHQSSVQSAGAAKAEGCHALRAQAVRGDLVALQQDRHPAPREKLRPDVLRSALAICRKTPQPAIEPNICFTVQLD